MKFSRIIGLLMILGVLYLSIEHYNYHLFVIVFVGWIGMNLMYNNK